MKDYARGPHFDVLYILRWFRSMIQSLIGSKSSGKAGKYVLIEQVIRQGPSQTVE